MVNNYIIIGNLTKEPEVREHNGLSIANMRLASIEKRKNKDGDMVETALFISATAFGKVAEIIGKHSNKGDMLYLSGPLRNEEYERDGNKVQTISMTVRDFKFVGGRKKEDSSEAATDGVPF